MFFSCCHFFHSNGTQCQNSLKIWASLRILASLLTMPFPWEAKSRMWGYEVFFPVAQLVLAAPLFIMVMASQQKCMSSSREEGALSFLLSRSPSMAQLSHSQLVQNTAMLFSSRLTDDDSFIFARHLLKCWIGSEFLVMVQATWSVGQDCCQNFWAAWWSFLHFLCSLLFGDSVS